MNTLPNDLTQLLNKHLPITNSILLYYDRSDYSKYTNIVSHMNKLDQVLLDKHVEWINYCFHECYEDENDGIGTLRFFWQYAVELFEFYRKGIEGLVITTNDWEQRDKYVEGLAKGQHKELFLGHFNSKDGNRFLLSLLFFEDSNFIIEIINKLKVISSRFILAISDHRRYDLANYIIENEERLTVYWLGGYPFNIWEHINAIIDGKLNPSINTHINEHIEFYPLIFMKLKHLNYINDPKFFNQQLVIEYFAYSRTIWDSFTDEQRSTIFMNDQHDDRFDTFICSISQYIDYNKYLSYASPSQKITDKSKRIYIHNRSKRKPTRWYLEDTVGVIVKNIIISSINFHIEHNDLDTLRKIVIICLQCYGAHGLQSLLICLHVNNRINDETFISELLRVLNLSEQEFQTEALNRFDCTSVDSNELLKYFIMNTY